MIRDNRPTRLPSIPDVPLDISNPEMRIWMNAIKEATEVRIGQRGDPLDRGVTLRDLTDSTRVTMRTVRLGDRSSVPPAQINDDYIEIASIDNNTQLTADDVKQMLLNELGYEHFNVAAGAFPIKLMSELPLLPDPIYPIGAYVSLLPGAILYQNRDDVWVRVVNTSDIEGQMTSAQIESILASKISGQITGTQISDNAISTPKLAANAITANEIAANAITADKILAGSINADKIAANSITSANIAAGAITADEIAADAITAGKILAGAILADKIAAGAITATKIAAGAITADSINANGLTIRDVNGNLLLDASGVGAAIDYTKVGGTKPPATATSNNIFRQPSQPSGSSGDIWIDTSTGTLTPTVKINVSGTWQLSSNLVSNTNQLTDGASLGSTAVWTNVTSRPTSLSGINSTEGTKLSGVATGATQNRVFRQTTQPSGTSGDIWIDTGSTPNRELINVSGTWRVAATVNPKITSANISSYMDSNAIPVTYIPNLAANKITTGSFSSVGITVTDSSGNWILRALQNGSGASLWKPTCTNLSAGNVFNPTSPSINTTSVANVSLNAVTTGTANSNHAIRGRNGATSSSGIVGAANGRAFFAETGGYGPFTGCHEGVMEKAELVEVGDILVDVHLLLTRGVDDGICYNEVSKTACDKRVVGIYTHSMPLGDDDFDTENLEHSISLVGRFLNHIDEWKGPWKDVLEDPVILDQYRLSHALVGFNSVGEGLVNVCGEGGDIEVGDYIVSSSMAGKGMKQADDIYRNYTVAKSRETVTFSSPTEIKQIACIYLCG